MSGCTPSLCLIEARHSPKPRSSGQRAPRLRMCPVVGSSGGKPPGYQDGCKHRMCIVVDMGKDGHMGAESEQQAQCGGLQDPMQNNGASRVWGRERKHAAEAWARVP